MAQKELGLRSRASSSASLTSSPVPAFSTPSTFSGVGGGKARPRSQSTLSARTASTLADRYLGFLQLAPGVLGLIGEGELVDVAGEGMGEQQDESTAGRAVKSASDYSYCADVYAGEGWRVIGDAGGGLCSPSACYHGVVGVDGHRVYSIHRPVLLVGRASGDDGRPQRGCVYMREHTRRLQRERGGAVAQQPRRDLVHTVRLPFGVMCSAC